MHPFSFFIDPPPARSAAHGFVLAEDAATALRLVGDPDASVVQLPDDAEIEDPLSRP